MNVILEEIEQLLAVQPPRFDMYTGIHKALRALMADTLQAVGRMDVQDGADLAAVSLRVQELLTFCAGHLAHENEFIHRAIEARAPGGSAAIAHDHEEHVREIDRLLAACAQLASDGPAQRPATAAQLYRELALFIAHNFEHMHVEETAHNAVLWARYTDAELVAIHDALVASIPPQEMLFTARWLLPMLNPQERLGLAMGMKHGAPPEVFDALMGVARPHLSETEWAKLMRGLEQAPVPGLVAA